MRRPISLTFGAMALIVSLVMLVAAVREGDAAQEKKAAPQIGRFESRSSVWGKHYPRQYATFMATRKSDRITDMLKKEPALVVLWAGYGFSKDYNAPRGHAYALEDNINTLRTGAPVDGNSGPMPTACWTCKSPDVPRLIAKIGEKDFFTGKWARHGGEIANPIGCADCHDSRTMALTVTREYLKRALDAEGSLKFADVGKEEMRSLVCAQCHSEYYFKKTPWKDASGQDKVAGVVTFPWDNGLSAEAMEAYYDERGFVDWTHKLSRAPMLKAQHPGYETFVTGTHGRNGVTCADCHMPVKSEGGVSFTSHQIGNPLDDMEDTCLSCHDSDPEELKAVVERKRERRDELSRLAMDILARAHLEAAKAWELGATEEEMRPALQDIRHGQWRWDYAVAAHGAFFHAPEEVLRVLGSAIAKAQEARVKLRAILAKYGAGDYEAPDFSTKEKAQALIGLPYGKLVEEKRRFLKGLRQQWIEEAKEKGIFDPASREGIEDKTSYQ
ncbi:MAG: ammonia-forming cytochrome c nitrite reductase [Deltaproteobacteria bacterium]|nr:ammonia-forming cytochrome c nitrite reductase [Deltaproteobacteria bacterium]